MRIRGQSGFTLIEVLVVVALTVLLFALLFTPMFAAFNLNKQARVRIDAQDAARLNLERISREISDAMFVYDNSVPIKIAAPGAPAGTATIDLANAKLDIVLPRMMMHCNDGLGHPDYERDSSAPDWPGEEAWPVCPVDQSENVSARPILPLTPSRRMVRYFIGLLHPDLPYSNSFQGPNNAPSTENNTYVLYRAEFSPWDNTLVPQTPNGPDLNKPDFFYDPQYSANWRRVSHIVGPVTNVDLVIFDRAPNGTYTGQAASSVRFSPTSVENEALSPTYLSDTEAEAPVAIPTVFRAEQGLWTPFYSVQVGRRGFSSIYYTQPDAGAMWLWLQGSPPARIFNISAYESTGDVVGSFAPGLTDEQKLALSVDEKLGEVKFVFNGEREVVSTNDINNPVPSNTPGFHQINKAQYGLNSRVVPGSEEVVGPDQTPFGPPRQVRYARVPLALGTPGLNQYKIDYDTGEMWFASGAREALPPDLTVTIDYKFHNNASDDIVRADYVTKNLLTITFGMRMFDSLAGKMYTTELTNKVHVKNTAR